MLALIKNHTSQRIPIKHLRRAFSFLEKKVPRIQKKEIAFIFIGDKRIKTLNRTYRKIDKVTDVLSFDVGDVFINPLQAKRQSKNYQREIVLLAIHGALHVIGYNHDTLKSKKQMFQIQDMIINKMFF